jgi:hypothetical protein
MEKDRLAKLWADSGLGTYTSSTTDTSEHHLDDPPPVSNSHAPAPPGTPPPTVPPTASFLSRSPSPIERHLEAAEASGRAYIEQALASATLSEAIGELDEEEDEDLPGSSPPNNSSGLPLALC